MVTFVHPVNVQFYSESLQFLLFISFPSLKHFCSIKNDIYRHYPLRKFLDSIYPFTKRMKRSHFFFSQKSTRTSFLFPRNRKHFTINRIFIGLYWSRDHLGHALSNEKDYAVQTFLNDFSSFLFQPNNEACQSYQRTGAYLPLSFVF